MKTTLEIPDELFREAKATAAHRGETLKELVNAALEAHLAENRPRSGRSGWRSVFGLADPKQVALVDRVVARELEHVDPSEWE
ncbi:MAG TPA: type II toxin-antitoxin system VapB family antitoxin [Thermoanaerobaculia bacterium]|nr:type II toxin-antitoxin system VapB family antitoxin [Thermoanaerobaculia bacterium]